MTGVQSVALFAVAIGVFVAGVAIGRLRGPGSGPGSGPDVSPSDVGAAVIPEVPARSERPEAPDPAGLLLRLSQAVDQIEQGVVVCDASGADVFRNRAARRFPEARDGLVLVEAAVRELLGLALEGVASRREVELFGPPAQSFLVSAYPFDDGSEPGGLALIDDRSLQKRTETVRRDFVANISHELKTPIGALGLLAETIRDEPDTDVVARLAERMIAEADRAAATVDDLLELSRIEFGDDAEFSDLDVMSVLSEAVGRIAAAADQAEITVVVDADPALRVHVDRRQLVSALFNLLDNSVKYAPSGSEIVLAATRTGADRTVELSVADAGVGIPRRDLDRIFERFYRVDRARSRGTGGTGLGLAIVRHVASNHGGEVLVDSTEGVGTVFRLALPVAVDLVADTPRASSGPVPVPAHDPPGDP